MEGGRRFTSVPGKYEFCTTLSTRRFDVFTIPEMSEIWTLLTENASVRIRDEGGEGI